MAMPITAEVRDEASEAGQARARSIQPNNAPVKCPDLSGVFFAADRITYCYHFHIMLGYSKQLDSGIFSCVKKTTT